MDEKVKKSKTVVISKRLQALAEMVTPGNRVVDIGCDHGFLPIFLVQKELSPKVLAMDVRKGPLSGAKTHVAEYGLEDYIETRLSDGLKEYHIGEAQSCVCAGMGGPLMIKILTESRDKAESLEELILQPQSEIPEFRKFLREAGYVITDENILCEDGKYYFPMKVRFVGKNSYGGSDDKAEFVDEDRMEIYDRYGRHLLEGRHPVLKDYLEASLVVARQIEDSLILNDSERARERLTEVRAERNYLECALAIYR
ncbi:MAG: SAM-dependent methyltransferase [Lachnospiraceae bacterium]|nr:SAM-dependent methyltransferase [Lachnospiraceae bacterium]